MLCDWQIFWWKHHQRQETESDLLLMWMEKDIAGVTKVFRDALTPAIVQVTEAMSRFLEATRRAKWESH